MKKRLTKKATTPNKKVRNAKPHVYDEIQFRSGLEVYCYQQLRKYGIYASYEEVSFTILDPFRYNNELIRKMSYTPDFVGDTFIIECKGFANESFPLRWKFFKWFLYKNDLNFDLYLPRNKKEVDNVILNILNKNK